MGSRYSSSSSLRLPLLLSTYLLFRKGSGARTSISISPNEIATFVVVVVVVVFRPLSPFPFFVVCLSVGDHCLFALLLKCSFGFRLLKIFVPLFTRFLDQVEFVVPRRKNKAVFVLFFWSSGKHDAFINGSSRGLFRAFRRIQPFAGLHIRLTLWSKLTSKVRFCLCLSVSLSMDL